MAWQNPKTDWAVNPKNPVPEDFNRIEGNIDFLKGDIETKKGVIVAAINDMNQPAQVSDTHAQLASKIRDISKDATAAVGDVEKGKTFYAGGQKRTGTLELTGNATAADVLSGKTFYNTNLKSKVTGTMPNRGAVVITPGTSNQTIQAGYHNGQGYVKGDANLKPKNIVKGVSIFGVAGDFNGKLWASGSTTTDDNGNVVVSGLSFKPNYIIVELVRPGGALRLRAVYADPAVFKSSNNTQFYAAETGMDSLAAPFSITSNGFSLRYSVSYSHPVNWIAFA